MNMPRFTTEESIYKTSTQYQVSGIFGQAGVVIHMALGKETDGPVGWQLCMDKCTMKCGKDKGCNQMAPAAKAKCKLNCEKGCMSDCTAAGGSGAPTKLTCDFMSGRWLSCNIGIPVWEAACVADGGGPLCAVAADKMKADSHCEVC
jgi:hypothetical protein